MFKTLFAPLIAAPLLIAAATPALAAAPVTEPTAIRIAYADLDLSSAAGRKALSQRIDRAAAKACAVPTDYRDLAALQHSMDCRTRAATAAQVQLAGLMEQRQAELAEAGAPAHGG